MNVITEQPAPSARAVARPTQEVKMNQQTRVRVLLVEGSGVVRERLRSLIEEACPAQIIAETDTGAGALAQFREHRPDAVVLDMNLADGEGCLVLREMKRSRPSCVVIVLANFVTEQFRDFCLSLGADFFFEKSREFERVPEVLACLQSTSES